ncbi:MAG: radical SAM protein [Candidatus Aminicenantales bacterium]
MIANGVRYSYGPVPSRRLGKSLGINNIPAKVCTYSCVYCQVGRTTRMLNDRSSFFEPEDIFRDVQRRLTEAKEASERVDYLTFVPDGEPTLDMNLGTEIMLLRELKVPVGVITNSSLLWRDDVKEDLAKADWVSLKIDAVQEIAWRRINRPHKAILLSKVLDGIRAFAKAFAGKLVSETMLVRGVNDGEGGLEEVADFLHEVQPHVAYLSIPTRPPAERGVRSPDEEALTGAYQILADKVRRVEYLVGYEGADFALTGEIEKDLLSITAVHPMREEAISTLLSRVGYSWDVVDRLVARGDLVRTKYDGQVFYLRRSIKDRRTAP